MVTRFRRICPGMHIAERSLYLLIARIAWACDIGKKLDENGNAIDVPLYDYCDGFNVQPKRFPFELTVRDQGRGEALEREIGENERWDPLKGRN